MSTPAPAAPADPAARMDMLVNFLVGETGIPVMVVGAALPDLPINLRIDEDRLVLVVSGQDVVACEGFDTELLDLLRATDEVPIAELPTPDAAAERITKVAYMMA